MLVLFLWLMLMSANAVAPWTVDLVEVGKFQDVEEENDVFYDYAKDFGYQSLKEGEEVARTLSNGSVYLEGLSRALMGYRDTLANCSNSSNTQNGNVPSCDRAAKSSEYLRKLSDLALLTADKLRDKENDATQENELVLQLAWLLDRLARFIGYEPIHDDTDAETTTRIGLESSTKINETSLELLEQVESNPLSRLPPKNLTAVKSVRKRSVSPLDEVVRYYVKYKLWNASNTSFNTDNKLDVENYLRVKPVDKKETD